MTHFSLKQIIMQNVLNYFVVGEFLSIFVPYYIAWVGQCLIICIELKGVSSDKVTIYDMKFNAGSKKHLFRLREE